jgi:hypothetical protein
MVLVIGAALLLLLAGPAAVAAFGPVNLQGDWARATHNPSGLAPPAASTPEAVVQVYAARAFRWRAAFAVHTWIAAKPAGADQYTRYEVIGWNLRRGGSAVAIGSYRAPDAQWFGAEPMLVGEYRGEVAAKIIAQLPAAAASYPYADTYQAWPGPNSNTFVAHVMRGIPEFRLGLPPHAVGKDFLPGGAIFAVTPSHTGIQAQAYGLLGVTVGVEEGLELNVLGLVVGLNPLEPSIKLPGIGSFP